MEIRATPAASLVQEGDYTFAFERHSASDTTSMNTERWLWSATSEEDDDGTTAATTEERKWRRGRRKKLARERDSTLKELEKAGLSPSDIAVNADETEDVCGTRRGPRWMWEVYIVAATLVLGLESVLVR